ncbi:hypothetical protein RRG08_001630 [Elysia crispata]|uniref:Uncharacterized protein n=1 Tax=Elysia crispata TaxID=231223 RepID=A0AAE1E0N4_9GAST|nr:hypothetical protein RRG08_001630 [Elysia crispata]
MSVVARRSGDWHRDFPLCHSVRLQCSNLLTRQTACHPSPLHLPCVCVCHFSPLPHISIRPGRFQVAFNTAQVSKVLFQPAPPITESPPHPLLVLLTDQRRQSDTSPVHTQSYKSAQWGELDSALTS